MQIREGVGEEGMRGGTGWDEGEEGGDKGEREGSGMKNN
jgi:hypothetical protein